MRDNTRRHRRRPRLRHGRLLDEGADRHAGTRCPAPRATRSTSPRTGRACATGRASGAARWSVDTAVTAWTPLGDSRTASSPYSERAGRSPATHADLVARPPTASVSARAATATRSSQDVYGDYTYIAGGTARHRFDRPADPADTTCRLQLRLPVRRRLPAAADRQRHDAMPYFTWKPLAGASRYFVLVSKDPNFTQHRRLRLHARRPRTRRATRDPTTYTDETTSYYWAVLPATGFDGSRRPRHAADCGARRASRSSRRRRRCSSPSAASSFSDQPTFQLDARRAARAATASRSRPTRPSATRSTTSSPTRPRTRATRPTRPTPSSTGASAPTTRTWSASTWSVDGHVRKHAAGAGAELRRTRRRARRCRCGRGARCRAPSSYDLSVDQPDGQHQDYADIRTPAASFIKMTGTGVWHWRVRAEFPKSGSGTDAGAVLGDCSRSPARSASPRTRRPTRAKDHVLLSWDPRLGVKDYKVQIASTPDFSRTVETVSTDNTSYAPAMTSVRLHRRRHALLARRRRGRGPQPGRLDADPADPPAASAAGHGQRLRAPQARELGARDRASTAARTRS